MKTAAIKKTGSRKANPLDDFNGADKQGEYKKLSGGEIFVESLLAEGVDTVFGYPGGVVLGLYDVLFNRPELRHILVRHECGGTFAADGYARATGKPGVVLVTSGPGATNTITGITSAFMDSVPIVVFTGQVVSSMIGNDAFQEADMIGLSRPITKHSYLVKDSSQLTQIIKEAFYIAASGKPGPVVIDMPKDMLNDICEYVQPSQKIEIRGYNPKVLGNVRQIKRASNLIKNAQRPVFYVGGGVINANATEELKAVIEKSSVPITTTLLGLGAFPESSPLALGMLGMHGTWYANTAVDQCDLLIAVGARFDDRITGRLDKFSQGSKKIHIDIDPSCIGKNVPVDVPIVGDAKKILATLVDYIEKPDIADWKVTIDKWKEEHPLTCDQTGDEILPQYMVRKISEVTKGEAIVVTDVGQHQMWTAQHYTFNHPRSHITSGGLGSMGFGFPAALGAAVGRPDRTVVCITGDAGFQMSMYELATAVHYKIPVIIAIMNNGYLGMVRQWQELFFGGRYSHSDLDQSNPDFVKLAESFGAVGMRVSKPDELEGFLKKALKVKDKPVVLDIVVKREENCYPMIPAGGAAADMVEND